MGNRKTDRQTDRKTDRHRQDYDIIYLVVVVVSVTTRREEIDGFVEEIVVKVWVRAFVVEYDRTRVHHLLSMGFIGHHVI